MLSVLLLRASGIKNDLLKFDQLTRVFETFYNRNINEIVKIVYFSKIFSLPRYLQTNEH